MNYLLLAFLLLGGSPEESEKGSEETFLGWKLEKGAKTPYELERSFKFSSQDGSGKALPGGPAVDQTLRMKARSTIVDVGKDHTAQVSLAVERVRFEIKGAMAFSYDSEAKAKRDQPPGTAELVKELDQLAKSTLTFKVSPKDGLTEFRLSPDLASAMSREPAAYVELGALLSEQGLEQFLKEVFVTLPNAPIKKGYSWQQKGTLGPGMEYEDDLTYRGPKPKEPGSAMIEMKRKMVSEGGAGGAVEDQESKGELILESKTGRLKQMELRHRLRMTQSMTLPNNRVLKQFLAVECVDKATTAK